MAHSVLLKANEARREPTHPAFAVGDSYVNALAESVNGYYKAELIRGPARQGPWRTVEEVD